MKRLTFICAAGLGLAGFLPWFSAAAAPAPFRVPAKLPDLAETLSPAALHLEGWLGERLTANAKNRLLRVDSEPLLAGFRKKPGSHPWIGEHVGKWMHAATLAWAYTGDAALRAKLDRVAADLIACQEPDGYLGTYVTRRGVVVYGSGHRYRPWIGRSYFARPATYGVGAGSAAGAFAGFAVGLASAATIASPLSGPRWDGGRSARRDREDARAGRPPETVRRSEERRVGKECRSRWSPYH